MTKRRRPLPSRRGTTSSAVSPRTTSLGGAAPSCSWTSGRGCGRRSGPRASLSHASPRTSLMGATSRGTSGSGTPRGAGTSSRRGWFPSGSCGWGTSTSMLHSTCSSRVAPSTWWSRHDPEARRRSTRSGSTTSTGGLERPAATLPHRRVIAIHGFPGARGRACGAATTTVLG